MKTAAVIGFLWLNTDQGKAGGLMPTEVRYWGDEGEYLGKDMIESLITLKYLGFSVPKHEKKET